MNRPSVKPEKKKPYEAPKLIVYGNLAEMTQGTGTVGHADSPPGGGRKRYTGAPKP
jgi:hypothetical protein